MRIGGAGALLLGLATAAFAPAMAQDGDARALQERLQKLDRELNAVQQQVYRGGTRPPAPAAPAAPEQNAAAAGLQVRLTQFQTDLRSTTGQIEEINFAVGDMR